MQHDDDLQPGRRTRSLVLPAVIAALVILMVILHLTGVVGPGSH
jgi:hypothetical protein